MDSIVKTDRLHLRQPSLKDSDCLFKLMSDSRLTKFLNWEPHTNIETTQKVINSLINAQLNEYGYHWCVCLQTGEIIGLISLIDIKRQFRTWLINRAELAYWITPNYQGKGYATEAASAVIKYGFEKLNLHKIIVAHAAENFESKRICEKLGFEKYAYDKDAFYKGDKWYDLVWYYKLVN